MASITITNFYAKIPKDNMTTTIAKLEYGCSVSKSYSSNYSVDNRKNGIGEYIDYTYYHGNTNYNWEFNLGTTKNISTSQSNSHNYTISPGTSYAFSAKLTVSFSVSKYKQVTIYKYVDNKIKDNGYKIDNYNIDYLLSKIGNDINNINSELDKLFIYKENDKKILKDDIDLLILDNIDNVIYEFTNAILDEDIDKVKSMYDRFMIDNIGFDYLISTVAGSFRTNLIIKILYNKNMSNFDIGKVIGKKEYFVKKSIDRLYRYSLDDLLKYINQLAIIDRDFKMGKDNVSKFELFLFSKESL